MSKSSTLQKLAVLKEWIQQMERDERTFQRYRRKVKRTDEEDTPTFKEE